MTVPGNDVMTSLSSLEAVHLAHPLVSALAKCAGVRVIFIKGVTLQLQGLRRTRNVSDVDVLVEPGGAAALEAALVRSGWYRRPGAGIPGGPAHHAVSYIHDGWPIDIDVHSWMPGLQFSGSEACFEVFWKHHIELEIAGILVPAPAPEHSMMLGVAHCLRERANPSKQEELQQYVEAYQSVLSETERGSLIDTAVELTALEVLSPWLRERGVLGTMQQDERNFQDLTPEQRANWRRACSTSRTVLFAFWMSRNLRARVQIIRWIFWPSKEQLAIMPNVSNALNTKSEVRNARASRLARAFLKALNLERRLRS